MDRIDYLEPGGWGGGGGGGGGAFAPHFSRGNFFLVLVWGTYKE